jgi:hypothetical protein
MTDIVAPTYRYFTADLLSNEILSEIPFQGVTYERALKGAGSFSGGISVSDETDALDLYNSTMPGNTALFVVRDGVCVWGGILWNRTYDVVGRRLSVSALEFTSYFYHRRIWKTLNHEFGATLTVASNGTASAVLDYGSVTTAITGGSTVRLQFSSGRDVRFDDYYVVSSIPAPTTTAFTLASSSVVRNIIKISRDANVVTVTTDASHRYAVDDMVDISVTLYPQLAGKFKVLEIDETSANIFRYALTGDNIDEEVVTGTSTRSLPVGTYSNVTVITRTDTYQYIRDLLNAVFSDFVGTDFPNSYIEPGLSYSVDVISKEILSGVATLKTKTDHGLAVGQAVQLKNVGKEFDGEHEVTKVQSDISFSYASGGTVALVGESQRVADISKIEASKGVITVTTVAAHGYSVGQTVQVTSQLGYRGRGKYVNGTYTITDVGVLGTTFKYKQTQSVDMPEVTFIDATATVGGTTKGIVEAEIASDKVTLTTSSPHSFAVGNTVAVVGATPYYEIVNRSYKSVVYSLTGGVGSRPAGSYIATITFPSAHGFYLNESIQVNGFTSGNVSLNTGVNVYVTILSVSNDKTSFTYTTLTNTALSGAAGGVAKARNRAELELSGQGYLQSGDIIDVIGLAEQSDIVSVHIIDSSKVTFATSTAHAFYDKDIIDISGLTDVYTITKRGRSSGVVTFETKVAHNLPANDNTGHIPDTASVTVSNIYDTHAITQWSISKNVGKVFIGDNHGIEVNDDIEVYGVLEFFVGSARVKKKKDGEVFITLPSTHAHNFQVEQEVTIAGLGGVLYGGSNTIRRINSVEGNIIGVSVMPDGRALPEDFKGSRPKNRNITIKSPHHYLNGAFKVSATTLSTVSYEVSGAKNISVTNVDLTDSWYNGTDRDQPTVLAASDINGTFNSLTGVYATNVNPTTFSVPIAGPNIEFSAVAKPPQYDSETRPGPEMSTPSRFNQTGLQVLLGTAEGGTNTFSVLYASAPTPITNLVASEERDVTSGVARKTSSMAGNNITVLDYAVVGTNSRIKYNVVNGPYINIDEQSINSLAYVKATTLFNTASASITDVDTANNQFSFAKTHNAVPATFITGFGDAVVRPVAIASTYGPYPGNADIGMTFSTSQNSGVNVAPTVYRGFELVSVGEALDRYSDSIDGFEYRVDCSYNDVTKKFDKKFVLIPINYPDPPTAGQVSPLSRFGAEKLVFEYPGNIGNLSIDESANNSATRFFASGETDLGADFGPNISVAADTELLNGMNGRKWPLLDDDEKVDGVDDKTVLYAYAKKYMTEARPPDATITISVNGSIEPIVGTYNPGDWCSIVVNDRFILARLATDLEPRDNVLVRKIESISVSVPDGVTFPERVTLNVVPEWEVDTRG